MSLERRFGVGTFALGVGQGFLAAATLLAPESDGLTGWTMAFLSVASVALGGLVLSERLPLDVAESQRRLLGVIATASIVGGVAGTLVGVFFLTELFLG